MKPQNRRNNGRGRGRGGAYSSGPTRRAENDNAATNVCPSACLEDRHVAASFGIFTARGGRVHHDSTSSRFANHRPTFFGPEAPILTDETLPIDTVIFLSPKRDQPVVSEISSRTTEPSGPEAIPEGTLPIVSSSPCNPLSLASNLDSQTLRITVHFLSSQFPTHF